MKILILFIISFPFLIKAQELEKFCLEKRGKIQRSHTCPKSKVTLPIKTCIFHNELDQGLFVNGCSGPTGGNGKAFFKACIKHDLCYHHEPISNGLSRKDCDQIFLDLALEGCTESPKPKKCRRWANIMYRSLRVIGGPAYNCSNEKALY